MSSHQMLKGFVRTAKIIILFFVLEVVLWGSRNILGKDDLGLFRGSNMMTTPSIGNHRYPCNRMRTNVYLSHEPDDRGDCLVKGGVIREGGFIEYQTSASTVNLPVILTLGGSTTSGFYQFLSDGMTWPYILADQVSARYRVLNGGVGAYSSQEEFEKLIRKGRRIRELKYVISLSGLNDMPGYGDSDPPDRGQNYPFETKIQYQMNMNQTFIDQRLNSPNEYFPNVRSLLRFLVGGAFSRYASIRDEDFREYIISKGQKGDSNSFYRVLFALDVWKANIVATHAMLQAMGIKYYVFLQPTLGLDREGDLKRLDRNSNDYRLLSRLPDDYVLTLQAYYKHARTICAELSFCFDISDQAKPDGNMYYDDRHHNARGNAILAEIIAKKAGLNEE